MEVVKVDHLNFSFGNQKVLEDISFSVEEGDFLAIIGPNGSGKSTLIKIMVGLIKATSGKVELFGMKDITWSQVGYVQQNVIRFDRHFPATVGEIVWTGLISTRPFPRLHQKVDEMKIQKALKSVGLTGFAQRKIGELSGGETQRVFIARAIIAKPKLLILDEPSTGVDQNSRKLFYDMLHHINKHEKITIILVTHELSYITKYVNKVACLNQRLYFHGSHEKFCEKEMMEDMHKILHQH